MTDSQSESENNIVNNKRMRIFVRPQTVCDYFIATMDPKDPFKICLYPSANKGNKLKGGNLSNQPDELNDLVLHNYLSFRRSCLKNE